VQPWEVLRLPMLPVFHDAAWMNSPEFVTRTDHGTLIRYGSSAPPIISCGFFFSMTTLVPRYVGVAALPSDTGKTFTIFPSEVTVRRSELPLTWEMCAAPIFITSVRLSSNASPGPAFKPLSGIFISIVEWAGQ
jgi:hypothetical protein